MDPAEIRAFVERDRESVERARDAWWTAWKHAATAAEVFALGEVLRQHVRTLRPDWPDEAERAADLAVHVRVTEALRAVSTTSSR